MKDLDKLAGAMLAEDDLDNVSGGAILVQNPGENVALGGENSKVMLNGNGNVALGGEYGMSFGKAMLTKTVDGSPKQSAVIK